jgi:hypothetical protein
MFEERMNCLDLGISSNTEVSLSLVTLLEGLDSQCLHFPKLSFEPVQVHCGLAILCHKLTDKLVWFAPPSPGRPSACQK